jgi:hypothetical protein
LRSFTVGYTSLGFPGSGSFSFGLFYWYYLQF